MSRICRDGKGFGEVGRKTIEDLSTRCFGSCAPERPGGICLQTTADCTQAGPLIAGLTAGLLLADRGYDTNAILEQAAQQGMNPVIPPRKHRLIQRDYDKYLYKLRHLVENAVLRLKGWRGIATRYAKRASPFLAILQIRCLVLWVNLS